MNSASEKFLTFAGIFKSIIVKEVSNLMPVDSSMSTVSNISLYTSCTSFNNSDCSTSAMLHVHHDGLDNKIMNKTEIIICLSVCHASGVAGTGHEHEAGWTDCLHPRPPGPLVQERSRMSLQSSTLIGHSQHCCHQGTGDLESSEIVNKESVKIVSPENGQYLEPTVSWYLTAGVTPFRSKVL